MIIDHQKKKISRICRICRTPKANLPDVFWDGKPEENLADDPVTGKPISFTSKGQKAKYLESKGLREAGDRHRGSDVFYSRMDQPKTNSKHEIKMALKKIKDMGAIARRQEYLRITKEGRSHVRG